MMRSQNSMTFFDYSIFFKEASALITGFESAFRERDEEKAFSLNNKICELFSSNVSCLTPSFQQFSHSLLDRISKYGEDVLSNDSSRQDNEINNKIAAFVAEILDSLKEKEGEEGMAIYGNSIAVCIKDLFSPEEEHNQRAALYFSVDVFGKENVEGNILAIMNLKESIVKGKFGSQIRKMLLDGNLDLFDFGRYFNLLLLDCITRDMKPLECMEIFKDKGCSAQIMEEIAEDLKKLDFKNYPDHLITLAEGIISRDAQLGILRKLDMMTNACYEERYVANRMCRVLFKHDVMKLRDLVLNRFYQFIEVLNNSLIIKKDPSELKESCLGLYPYIDDIISEKANEKKQFIKGIVLAYHVLEAYHRSNMEGQTALNELIQERFQRRTSRSVIMCAAFSQIFAQYSSKIAFQILLDHCPDRPSCQVNFFTIQTEKNIQEALQLVEELNPFYKDNILLIIAYQVAKNDLKSALEIVDKVDLENEEEDSIIQRLCFKKRKVFYNGILSIGFRSQPNLVNEYLGKAFLEEEGILELAITLLQIEKKEKGYELIQNASGVIKDMRGLLVNFNKILADKEDERLFPLDFLFNNREDKILNDFLKKCFIQFMADEDQHICMKVYRNVYPFLGIDLFHTVFGALIKKISSFVKEDNYIKDSAEIGDAFCPLIEMIESMRNHLTTAEQEELLMKLQEYAADPVELYQVQDMASHIKLVLLDEEKGTSQSTLGKIKGLFRRVWTYVNRSLSTLSYSPRLPFEGDNLLNVYHYAIYLSEWFKDNYPDRSKEYEQILKSKADQLLDLARVFSPDQELEVICLCLPFSKNIPSRVLMLFDERYKSISWDMNDHCFQERENIRNAWFSKIIKGDFEKYWPHIQQLFDWELDFAKAKIAQAPFIEKLQIYKRILYSLLSFTIFYNENELSDHLQLLQDLIVKWINLQMPDEDFRNCLYESFP